MTDLVREIMKSKEYAYKQLLWEQVIQKMPNLANVGLNEEEKDALIKLYAK